MINLLIAQSGGPTAAINASLSGIAAAALAGGRVNRIYGGINGIKGILDGKIKEIGPALASAENLELLALTPASALGTCRFKLDDKPETYDRIIAEMRKFDITHFIYIGGNDSMDTVTKLSRHCAANGGPVITGVPKTIDNDLCVMDHTPGFGTAAKYIALTLAECFRDVAVYDFPQVAIFETMGRHAGWLAAASCLAGINGGDSPHLIYLPEAPLDEKQFIQDIKNQMKKTPYALVVVSEGVKDANGVYICEKEGERGIDAFNHKLLSGAGNYLGRIVTAELGCKVRNIDLSLSQRCSAHAASRCDIDEAKLLGAAALSRALEGASGQLPVLERVSDEPYKIKIEFTDAANVANLEKKVPRDWLNEAGNNVNKKMIDYLRPLIQGECPVKYRNGVPVHIKLY